MASAFPTSVDNETALVDGTDKMRASTSINLAFLDITSTQTMIGASGAAQTHNTDILTQLANFKAPQLQYNGTNNFDVLAGSIIVQNAGGSVKKLRRNTSTTNVTASNLDTGAMAVGYYYVYAIGDATATTFTVKFSATANAAPSGTTYYCMIGWFYNETGGVLDVTSKFFGNVKANGRDVPNKIAIRQTADNSSAETVNAAYTVLGTTGGGKNFTGRFYSTGRPVVLLFTATPALNATDTQVVFGAHVDSTLYGTSSSYSYGPQTASISTICELAEGTHTIEIKHKQGSPAASTLNFTAAVGAGFPSLVAYEL